MIFRNCNILDFEKEGLVLADIRTENGVIKEIKENLSIEDDEVDVGGRIVMPGFCNCYLNLARAKANSFNLSNEEILKKNVLSGVTFSFLEVKKATFLENLDEYDEKMLDEIGLNLQKKVFVKVGQSLDELGKLNKLHQKLPSEVLEDFGFLDKNTTIIGGNCFEKDELELFSGYNASFVLLPNDDARTGRRFLNINILKRLQIPFGIGSGEFAEVDFFAFMRQILSFNSFVMENSSLMSPKEVLLSATTTGAKILGFDGEIKVGGGANFIVINRSFGYDNIFKEIVFGKCKRDVFMTVKNGKILQQNGVFAGEI